MLRGAREVALLRHAARSRSIQEHAPQGLLFILSSDTENYLAPGLFPDSGVCG
jgi:hypothetical protein